MSEKFNLVLIDGILRDECVSAALPSILPGGCLYLDNTDKPENDPAGDLAKAVELVRKALHEREGTIQIIRDFAPATLAPTEAILANFQE
jgi:hypothetical protein